MANTSKRLTTTIPTASLVDAVKVVQDMSGKRARFVLIALLTGEHIPLAPFHRACRMADHPVPIEASGNPFNDYRP